MFSAVVLITACKASQKSASAKNKSVSTQSVSKDSASKKTAPAVSETMGTVSHRYSSTGCPAVVVTNVVNPRGDTLILIPVHGLERFDTDGLKISFNYRRVLVKNPPGCYHGVTAILYNVKKQ